MIEEFKDYAPFLDAACIKIPKISLITSQGKVKIATKSKKEKKRISHPRLSYPTISSLSSDQELIRCQLS